MPKEILSKEPWWAAPPQPGQTEWDVEWGYLVFYNDGTFEFITSERPSKDEIRQRIGCRIGNAP